LKNALDEVETRDWWIASFFFTLGRGDDFNGDDAKSSAATDNQAKYREG